MTKSLIYQFIAVMFAWCATFSPALAVDSCPHAGVQKMQIPADRPKIGLALGGGGTRGAAHAGVLRVLERAGIPIDYIAGTSAGAIVGGLYCAGLTPAEIEECLFDRSLMRSFISKPLYLSLLEEPIKLSPRLVGHKSYVGLYDGRKFLKYLNQKIPACKKEISALPIPFRAVALNLKDGQVYAIDKGNLGLAILASSAVPSLRQPVPIGDQLFVDGGVKNNLPVDIVKQMGADIVIAVNVDESVQSLPNDHFKIFGAVPRRILLLQLADSDATREKDADILIHPNVDGIGLVSTRRQDSTRAMKSGEEATVAVLPAIAAALNRKLTLRSQP